MFNNRQYIPKFITATTGTQIFTGAGTVKAVVVGTTTGTPFVLYDSVGAASGTVALLKSSVAENTYTFDMSIANGLYITAGISGTYTIMYTK